MAERIKQYLSGRWISVIIFFIAVAIKAGLVRLLLSAGNDLLLMMLTTRNWMEGHGVSIGTVSVTDLSHTVYIPFTGWPPGVSLQFAFFVLLTGGKYFTALFVLQIVTTIFLFWVVRRIVLYVGFPTWQANIFILFEALMLGKYAMVNNPTDFLSLAYVLGGTLCLCHSIERPQSNRNKIGAIVFFVLAGLTRYQYIPVVLLMLVVLLLCGLTEKNKKLIRVSLQVFLATCFILAVTIIIFYIDARGERFISPMARGVYLTNISYVHPFTLATFADLDFYAMQISSQLHQSYSSIMIVFGWIGLALMIGMLVYFLKVLFIGRKAFENRWQTFRLIGIVLSLATICLLYLLSLFIGTQLNPYYGDWTFIMEARYFALPVLFLQILIWRKFFVEGTTHGIFTVVKWTLAIMIGIWMMHGLYFLIKQSKQPMMALEELPLQEKELKFVHDYIQLHQLNNSKSILVFSGINKRVAYAAGWYRASSLYEAPLLNSIEPVSSKETKLLVWVRDEDKDDLEIFLRRKGVVKIYEGDHFSFYEYEIPKRK